MAEKNLEVASFKERKEIISRLDVKVYPSEDLATVRIRLGGNLLFHGDDAGDVNSSRCRKITFGLR